ncbi:MAG: S-adenosylmethionine:tRNA ribosyltransferase-isomerase [Candidatus Shikimatogenerans bostrichidophilus]|nr:MAG: S-adenosylmethionine:tRNA ribosyltransferase-isomerase [Candidatus Shikimatogenerans bostrichidophilus]
MLPTSGVYINKIILLNLLLKSINLLDITLHLSLNKYFKFNLKKIYKFQLINSEPLYINNKFIKKFYKKKTKTKKQKICCFGTNTLRAIENIYYNNNKLIVFKGYINLLFPYKYKYKIVNTLLTYFNDINTINFLTTINLCNIETLNKIYKIAKINNYNFNTYGDLLLIIN